MQRTDLHTIEQSLEFQRPLVVNFIDCKKAFDSVHRDSLRDIMKLYGIPRNMFAFSKHCIRILNAALEHQMETPRCLT